MTTIPLCPSMKSMMNISKSLITINPLLSAPGGLFKLEKTIRAVIKRCGPGISDHSPCHGQERTKRNA